MAVNNIVLDVCNKKSFTGIVVVHKGREVKKDSYRSRYDNQYENLIEGYMVGLRMLIQYFDTLTEKFEGSIIITSNNSALLTWLKRGYSLPKYNHMFSQLMEQIDAIPAPIEYVVKNADFLLAENYAKSNMVKTEKVHSIMDILED